ncbi:MAG: hypothetical protein ACK4ND_17745 [Cytophagaceae bacterium]
MSHRTFLAMGQPAGEQRYSFFRGDGALKKGPVNLFSDGPGSVAGRGGYWVGQMHLYHSFVPIAIGRAKPCVTMECVQQLGRDSGLPKIRYQ